MFKSLLTTLIFILCFVSIYVNGEDQEHNSDIDKGVASDIKESVSIPLKLDTTAESMRLFRKDFILLTNEIVEKIQKNYPSLSKELTVEDKNRLIKAIVETLGYGIEYTDTKKIAKIKEISNSFPAIIIQSQKILYIRLDSFSRKNVEQLWKEMQSYLSNGTKPYGIVLDLRNAQGYNTLNAIKTLGLFISSDKIKIPNSIKVLDKPLSMPVLILIGKKTTGAAEIFASIMKSNSKAMLIGEDTAKLPFRKEVFTLSNGNFLNIPQVPKYLENMDIIPPVPSIKITTYPQIAFKKLQKNSDTISDKALRRAIDLIICLHALKK